jgi:FkbM family methyltransferase
VLLRCSLLSSFAAQAGEVANSDLDCVVSEWSDWSACRRLGSDVDTMWAVNGDGKPSYSASRQRSVASGLRGCPPLHEVQTCTPASEMAAPHIRDLTRGFEFPSQHEQDSYSLAAFFSDEDGNLKRNGVFVDVGAYDGKTLSNTYMFEKYLGWRGICVEPLPGPFQALTAVRTCRAVNACAFNVTGTVPFLAVGGYSEMLSGIVNTYVDKHLERIAEEQVVYNSTVQPVSEFPSIRLQDYLDEERITRVDLLSVDTENSELQVLSGIDYDRVFVDVVLVEEAYPWKGGPLLEFMDAHGFELITKLEIELVFRNRLSLSPK